MKKVRRLIVAGLFMSTWVASVSTQAAMLSVVATPQETSGPFRHNVFHTPTNTSGGGTIDAWFNLGNSGGFWDTLTGAFIIAVDLFSNSNLTGSLGSATGTGTLSSAEFNGNDGGLIGTIAWDFDVTAEGNSFTDVTMSFIDNNYVTSSAGHTANSTSGDFLTLWGADGYDANTDGFILNDMSRGVDLVVKFDEMIPPSGIPIPASVWLFGSGLLGLVGIARRRKA